MSFEYMITTEKIREKMFDDYLGRKRTDMDDYSFDTDSFNFVDGIYDSESEIFIIRFFMTNDETRYFCLYFVITDQGDVLRVYNNQANQDVSLHPKYAHLSAKVKEGIKFYNSNYYKIRMNLNDKQQKELEEVMFGKCRKCFGHKLLRFNRRGCNKCIIYYGLYSNSFMMKINENFRKYATDEKILRWRGKKYTETLMAIIRYSENNERKLLKKKYGDAIWYFGLGTDDTYDELFCKALKSSLEHGFKLDIKREVNEYISRYMWKYPDKGRNIEHLIRLLSLWN